MKVFITGATGYIGGSVAERLIREGHTVVGLVRSEEKAAQLQRRGIEPVIGSLDDSDMLTQAAQAADGVIHAANADREDIADVFIAALSHSGKFFIHTSGSGLVNDSADNEFAAAERLTEDSYFEPVPFRLNRVKMNNAIREAGIHQGVRTIVIVPSMIYGRGRGLHKESEQLPALINLSKQLGAAVYFGQGLSRYSNVHIDDLVDLYLLAIEKAPGASLFYAENGDASFKEIADMIARTQGFDGRTISVPVADLIAQFGDLGRYGVAANSVIDAANARRLGWKPRGETLTEFFETYVPGQ